MRIEVQLYLILGLVAAQVAVGLLLLSSITAMLRKANGLLNVTASHARQTDQTTRCATVAVNELREDVKAASGAAKEAASTAALVAVDSLKTMVNLDSFRANPAP